MDAIAVVSGITVGKSRREIDALGGDVLLILLLAIEDDDVLDGPPV